MKQSVVSNPRFQNVASDSGSRACASCDLAMTRCCLTAEDILHLVRLFAVEGPRFDPDQRCCLWIQSLHDHMDFLWVLCFPSITRKAYLRSFESRLTHNCPNAEAVGDISTYFSGNRRRRSQRCRRSCGLPAVRLSFVFFVVFV
ncbi:uncharacterized protein LOC144604259 [Rhinoraja longicauda]